MTVENFVSFGEQGAQLTYGSYLRLPQLLDSQHLESDPPAHDELLFITIHQVYELWFKQLLHEVDRGARRDVGRGRRLWWAQHLLARVHVIERVLVQQVDVLETMTPQDFLEFRQRLAPASGFQSVQFRELEFLSGAKDPSYVERFRGLTEAEQAAPRLPARRADAVGRVPRRARAPTTCRPAPTRRSRRRCARSRTTGTQYAVVWALAEALLQHDELAAQLAGPPRGDGRADDRQQVRHRRLQRRAVPRGPGSPLRYYPLLWDLRSGSELDGLVRRPAGGRLTEVGTRAHAVTSVERVNDDARCGQVRAAVRGHRAGPGEQGDGRTAARPGRRPAPGLLPPRRPRGRRDRSDVDVYGAFASHYKLAGNRPQGTARVRVFTPRR